jgi:hypothetical protein
MKWTVAAVHTTCVPLYIPHRKRVIRSEWAKIDDARSNDVFDKVEVMLALVCQSFVPVSLVPWSSS